MENTVVKKPLGKRWWLSLVGGFLIGMILLVGIFLAFAFTSFNTYKESVGEMGIDTNLNAAPQVLLDNERYKIEFIGFDKSSPTGEVLQIKINNKTGNDATLMGENIIVNGYTINSSLYEMVPPNAELTGGLSLTSNIQKMGIEKITDIQFGLIVQDEVTDEYQHFGPFTIQTDYYGQYDQAAKDKELVGEVVFDKDGLRISKSKVDIEGSLSPEYWLLIENNSSNKVSVYKNTITVNGITIDGGSFFPSELAPGAKTKEPVVLMMSDIEKNRIGKSIDTLEMGIDYYMEDPTGTAGTSINEAAIVKIQ